MMKESISVRYIVNDIDASIDFYTKILGFKVIMHPAVEFAILSLGNLNLLLSKPSDKGGGGQNMPDGEVQRPGGWNRISIPTENLQMEIERIKSMGSQFRNEIVTGVGGKQILLKDPSGNLIELFESYNNNL
jgi:catechol 2,3-dioxygenase-like lactoylglutathione lyase family enzyme